MKKLSNLLLEIDRRRFKVGDVKRKGDITTKVTDIDDTTNSVSWDVKSEITDDTIKKDLTSLINKFDKYKDQDKLKELVRELRSIRNRFSRTTR